MHMERTSLLFLAALGACHAALRAPLSDDAVKAFYRRVQAERAQTYAALNASARAQLYAGDTDIAWADAPGAWHQQTARIVDHRFKTFDAMLQFVMHAKKVRGGAWQPMGFVSGAALILTLGHSAHGVSLYLSPPFLYTCAHWSRIWVNPGGWWLLYL